MATELEGIVEEIMKKNLNSQAAALFRKTIINNEAEKEGSDIQCPQCRTYLPHRLPFFDWDNRTETAFYYCTLCKYEF